METVSKDPQVTLKIQWQWKSNSDPWSKAEEPQWESYSPEHNYLLEKAFYSQKPEVDIGEYIVSLQQMLQSKKGNKTSQRPIRRQICEEEEEEEMNLRIERYFDTELPKSINKVFGDLSHFISFFSRRNPDILGFTKQFQELEIANDLNGLNKIICPKLIDCLEEELLKPIEDLLKDPSISIIQKKSKQKRKERHVKLIFLFKKDLTSFEQFYGLILKSYTMNTGLYMSLNKYLRNESWTEIDRLLPYAVCLCKAFFSLKIGKNNEKKSSIILYRGTGFDELALSSYKDEKASRFFSWNSVTSTSTNRRIAERFMYASAKIENNKYPVLFIIEIPFAEGVIGSEYLKWIDIRQYSAIPHEDEVILAPGSTFEIEKVETDEETKRTIINLKLKHEVESLAHGGMIMQGAFQNEMMNDKQANIVCLAGEELSEALRNLAGNRLIEEIEFCLCQFDKKTLEEMLDILPTLKKARGLKLVSCKYEDEQGISSSIKLKEAKVYDIFKVEIYDVQNFSEILRINELWTSLRTLEVDFRNLELGNIKHLTQITSLALHFTRCTQITDEEITNMVAQGIKHLNQLISLSLGFFACKQITNEGAKNLALEGLTSLTQLTSLSLNFAECKQITDKAVTNLALEGLKYLTQLTSLNLRFSDCEQITNEGVNNLASQGLRYLTELTSLTLDFSDCQHLTAEAVSNLAIQGLQYNSKLTCLSLKFWNCLQITDEGVNDLVFQVLKHRTQLTSLSLNFSFNAEITDEPVRNLAFEVLQNLTQLTFLNLDFSGCEITDEGLSNLATQGLRYLTQLTSLTLSFFGIGMITDEGLTHLTTEGIQYLTNLTSLTFWFSCCETITDRGLSNLASQGLKKLTKLTVLDLEFFYNDQITNEGMKSLASEGLKFLTQLTFLHLFLGSEKQNMTDGINNLTLQAKQSLLHLTSFVLNEKVIKEGPKNPKKDENQYRNFVELFSMKFIKSKAGGGDGWRKLKEPVAQEVSGHFEEIQKLLFELMNPQITTTLDLKIVPTTLVLDFSQYEEITDDGVYNMASQGLKYLTQLTSLTLSFSKFDERSNDDTANYLSLTDKGMENLALQGLKYLTQLTSLTLDFRACKDITDEGVSKLASLGLRYLTQLTTLSLDFSWCKKIEGVNSLALEGLTKLTSLSLDFSMCRQMSDEGMRNLASQALRYLTLLTSLSIDFSWCREITSEGVANLASEGLRYLTQLTSLTLNFSTCRQITSEAVANLASQGIKNLTHLSSLTLDFGNCKQITDRAVSNLTSQGLKYLDHLTSLDLSFFQCEQVTDEAVNDLVYHLVKYPAQLTSLDLCFSSCRVTEFTASSITRALHYFGWTLDYAH